MGFGAGLLGAFVFSNQQKYSTNQVDPFQMVNLETPESAHSRSFIDPLPLDFVDASVASTASVVYIRNISEQKYRMSFMDMFFEGDGKTAETVSSGSGVIFTATGHIITNNHVVADADRLEVIHNKNTYEAQVIGTDPSSDIAVLKIEAKGLPEIKMGSSRELNVGEWVLAVGNPFNLTSTVTAGIVSAKGRDLNILKGKFPIESFIQTDAAINPGNSGGALVNIRGELVGINTAIISKTGSYAGYGFAVPVDIVKKLIEDILKFGEVQKSFLGASVSNLTTGVVDRLSLDIDPGNLKGVVIDYIQKDGTADNVGLREGDIILSVEGHEIDSESAFDEEIGYHSPGDEIVVKYKRGEQEKSVNIILTNREGTTSIIKTKIFGSEYLGAELEIVPKVERDLVNIENGVRIKKLYGYGLLNRLDLDEDFIVTSINNIKVDTPAKLNEILKAAHGKVRIEGVNGKGAKGYYTYYFR